MTPYVIGFAVISAVLIGWMLCMMTSRPDVWMRLVEADKQWRKAEEERKAKRDERHGKALKGGLAAGIKIAEAILKKK